MRNERYISPFVALQDLSVLRRAVFLVLYSTMVASLALVSLGGVVQGLVSLGWLQPSVVVNHLSWPVLVPVGIWVAINILAAEMFVKRPFALNILTLGMCMVLLLASVYQNYALGTAALPSWHADDSLIMVFVVFAALALSVVLLVTYHWIKQPLLIARRRREGHALVKANPEVAHEQEIQDILKKLDEAHTLFIAEGFVCTLNLGVKEAHNRQALLQDIRQHSLYTTEKTVQELYKEVETCRLSDVPRASSAWELIKKLS